MSNQFDPPHDDRAEAGALACVLNSEESKADVLLDELTLDDLWDARCQTVWRALKCLAADFKPLNTPTLYQWLKDKGELSNAGGAAFVSNLPDSTPSPEQFTGFLETLRDRTARRTILRDTAEIQRLASNPAIPLESVAAAAAKAGNVTPSRRKLPVISDAAQFVANTIPEPPQVIWDVLHQGCKMALGGGSKTFKTWTLLDLVLSVSHGEPWLSFKTTRLRTCYVNLELQPWAVQRRLEAIAREKRIKIDPDWLYIWNLRGYATDYREILPDLAAELRRRQLGLLVIDPTYKLYGNTDENSARDISALLNEFERLAQRTKAATAFAAHFSKGNQANKEAADRISGSGVFARDPDAILTFTRHEEDGAFTVDSVLRNCKTVEPFVVRWHYPLMRRDDGLDPSKLKQVQGRQPKYKPDQILECLKDGMSTTDWQKKSMAETGMSKSQFYVLLKQVNGRAAQDEKETWHRISPESPISPESHLPD